MARVSKAALVMAVLAVMLSGVTLSSVSAYADDGGWEPIPSHQQAEADDGWILIQASQGVIDEITSLKKQIRNKRLGTWRWQDVAFVPRSRTAYQERQNNNVEYLRWMANLWKARLAKAWKHAQNPPHEAQWLCIHGGEGSWTSNTGNGYYGGLQMDIDFQRTHGWRFLYPRGLRGPMVTADKWSPLQQMWVAENALRHGVSFHAWPTTAKNCGYI